MPGETPGVEHENLINRERVYGEILATLENGTFPPNLTEEASAKFHEFLKHLHTRRPDDEGIFFIVLSTSGEGIRPDEFTGIDWKAYVYGYRVEQGGNMGMGPLPYSLDSNDPAAVDIMTDPKSFIFNIDWDDMVWTRGYLTLMPEPPTYLRGEKLARNLPHPN